MSLERGEKEFDRESLYSNDPLDAALIHEKIVEFMTLVRSDTLVLPKDQSRVDSFCQFINDSTIWHVVDAAVPEFRNYERQQ